MSRIRNSLTALAAAAALASVGYAVAQTPDSTTTNADGSVTTTQVITDTSTQVLPSAPTGVVELNKPKGEVAPTDKQPNNVLGMANSLMTTGMVDGYTRPSVGDHATPPIPAEPTVLAVTTERTVTTTSTPVAVVAPAPAAAPVVATPEPVAEPMPAPRADRN